MPGARLRWLRLTPDRAVPCLLALEGILLLAERFGWFTFDRHKGYAPLVTIAAVGTALLLMLLWFLVAIVFGRRFQFSLRSLLLLVVVVAIPCSWLATEMKAAREQHAIVETIWKFHGHVYYDYEDHDPFALPSKPPGPAWLCELLGEDLFASVTWLAFYEYGSEFSDAELEKLKGLPHLQGVDLFATNISDSGLEHLTRLPQLKELDLSYTKVSDTGLEHLKGLTELQGLYLTVTKVSDSGVEKLQKSLPNTSIER